ncbi:MAG: DUF3109 family protein [Salibacteraceae bacterium]
MIQIGDKLVSLELLKEEFVCNLGACKGACCVEGQSGAPLTDEEVLIIEEEYENVRPFLRNEGVEAIEQQGTSMIDSDGDHVTPLREGKECAYTVFDESGTAQCGIELAWKDGKTSFRKPVSCHLYPIRTKRYPTFEAVNYERWQICKPACKLGAELKVPVFKFAKEALIRKYGEAWFEELELVKSELDKMD